MSTVFFRATLAAAALGMLAGSWQAVERDAIEDPEAYVVYAAVLAAGLPQPIAPDAVVALEGKTSAVAGCAVERRMMPGWQPVFESYLRENSRARTLAANLDLGVPSLIVTSAEYENLLMEAQGDARKTYEPFRGGTSFSVSAVGFDATKTRAMATLQRSCDIVCRDATDFFLEKQGAGWVVVRSADIASDRCG
jgi:hypothetical protein